MIELICTYAAIWAPSLASIFGIIVAVGGIRKALGELKSDTHIKHLELELEAVLKENKELSRCQKLLLDRITKIEGYADKKRGEK